MRVFVNASGRLRTGWRLLLFVMLIAALGGAIGALGNAAGLPRWIQGGVVQPVPQMLVGVLVLSVALAALWLMFRFVERRDLSTLGIPLAGSWISAIGVGLLLGGSNIVLFVVLLTISGNVELSWAGLSLSDALISTLPLALGFVTLAGWEELTLRGYALQLISEGLGPRAAIVVTGTIFGLLHASNPGANLQGLAFTILGGVLLGWLVVRTGSLWIVWGYHAGWNMVAALLFGLKVSGLDHPGAVLHASLHGPDWLTGGEYGFEGSLLAAWDRDRRVACRGGPLVKTAEPSRSAELLPRLTGAWLGASVGAGAM